MDPQFDWQVGDDEGRWETVVQGTERRLGNQRRHIPRWTWVLLLVGVVAGGSCAYAIVHQRYEGAVGQVAFQIQSVIDLEARAFAQGDRDLFLAQQDEASTFWYMLQSQRLGGRRGRRSIPPVAVLPAQVEDVNVQGDVAWVQVVEGDPGVRRVRFYRRTDGGWLRTAPDLAFWGDPIERQEGDRLIFRYHERDQPYIDPLLEDLSQAFYEACAAVRCPRDRQFEILVYPAPGDGDARTDLMLPSPWLSGIPVEGDRSALDRQAVLSALERQVSAWTDTGAGVQAPAPRRSVTWERWRGLVPATPEAAYWEISLLGHGSATHGRFDTW